VRVPWAALLLAGCGSGVVLTMDSGSTPAPPEGSEDDDDVYAGGPCEFFHDLDEFTFEEGDTIRFETGCVGLDSEDIEITLSGAPSDVSFRADGDAYDFRWDTDGTHSGPWELHIAAKAKGSDDFPETATLSLFILENEDAARSDPPDPETYTEELGLDVMHIEVDGSLSQSDSDATVWFRGKEYTGAQIKIRGASSSNYPKPGYTVEFGDDELGIPGWEPDDRDHLVLLSPFDDNSYVRQKLIYDQWAAMAEYWGAERLTPRTFYLVVYIDGEYNGLFIGLDRPDNEFIRHMGFDNSGNLYKAVNHNANFYLTDTSGNAKSSLSSGYEKKEGEPSTDFSDLEELIAFTGGSSDAQLVANASDHFSLEEWMDWFLLVSYSLSEDSAGKNSYLYHDPSEDTWRYVPWDFNHAWGQNWYTLRIDVDDINEYEGTNRVFKAIQSVSSSDGALWDRFRSMRTDGPFELAWMLAQVDGYYEEIDDAATRDWDRWGDAYRSYSGWAGSRNSYNDWTDYEEEKEYLYAWLEERAAVYQDRVPD